MKNKKDYSNVVGCWIDIAIPRTQREICERMTELAMQIGADSDQLAHESEDLSAEDLDMWFQDIQNELDAAINSVLNPSGFLAVWTDGDYSVMHQSTYFENESDYFTA